MKKTTTKCPYTQHCQNLTVFLPKTLPAFSLCKTKNIPESEFEKF